MNQRNKINLGLAFALAILIAVLAYDPAENIPEKTVLLTQLIPENIQKIIIEQSSRESIMLSKTSDQWQMAAPYNNQANTLRINKFLEIVNAKSHAHYSTSSLNLDQLKLITPDLMVMLDNTKLIFGTTDALKGYRYIQINNTVHLITDRYNYLIRVPATTLLNPTLLPKNIAITKLVLPEFTLQTNDTGWVISPENKSFSADKLQQLIDEWRFSRALSVSKLIGNIDNNTTDIEVHYDKNQSIIFSLTYTKDEIILSRADTGLRYHFATEAGNRLLKFQRDEPASTKSN
jgi:hypothetical protein